MNLHLLRRASDASPLRRASDGRALAAADAAALRSDAYIEELLASREPTVPPADLDPQVRNAAELLAAALVRFHPSFRFEEELAGRLRRLATATGTGTGMGTGSIGVAPLDGRRMVALRPPLAATTSSEGQVSGALGPLRAAGAGEEEIRGQLRPRQLVAQRQADVLPRQVLMGGAIASGVSLAGMALVAWRLGGPAGIVRRARAAGDTLLAPGRAVPAIAAIAGTSAGEEAG